MYMSVAIGVRRERQKQADVLQVTLFVTPESTIKIAKKVDRLLCTKGTLIFTTAEAVKDKGHDCAVRRVFGQGRTPSSILVSQQPGGRILCVSGRRGCGRTESMRV